MPDRAEGRRSVPDEPRRVFAEPGGPVLVEGPVEIRVEGCEPVLANRFLVAVCACALSGRYPLCDGSHRRRAGSAQRDAQ